MNKVIPGVNNLLLPPYQAGLQRAASTGRLQLMLGTSSSYAGTHLQNILRDWKYSVLTKTPKIQALYKLYINECCR